MKSNCCGAPPIGEIDQMTGIGYCSRCKEGAVFSPRVKSPNVKVRFIISCSETITMKERDLDEAVKFAQEMERDHKGVKVDVQFSWNNGLTWQDKSGTFAKKSA